MHQDRPANMDSSCLLQSGRHPWRQGRWCRLVWRAGDRLHAKVLRDGKQLDLSYVLRSRRPLVPVLHGVDCVPSYFIVGGLVFVPLSIPFLEHAYGGAPPSSAHGSTEHCFLSHCTFAFFLGTALAPPEALQHAQARSQDCAGAIRCRMHLKMVHRSAVARFPLSRHGAR